MALTASRWLAAEDHVIKGNYDNPASSAALSLGPGVCGADIWCPIDLGGNPRRIALTLGDNWWASVAGQSRLTSASINHFLHNNVILLTGAGPGPIDLETCTVSYWMEPGNADNAQARAFFSPKQVGGQTCWRYAFGGMKIADRLLCTGMYSRNKNDEPNNLGTTMMGPWGVLYDNVAANPDQWVKQECEFGVPLESFHSFSAVGAPPCSPVDGGDGFGYMLVQLGSRTNRCGMFRFDLARAYVGDLSRVEWLCGAPGGGKRWRADLREGDRWLRARRNVLGFSIDGTDQVGGIHRRPSGAWQLTWISDGFPVRVGDTQPTDPRVEYAVVSALGDTFTATRDVYDIPVGAGRFYYQPSVFPVGAVTWAGMAADDQAVIYSHNNTSFGAVASDQLEYIGEILKVTGWGTVP